MNTVPSPIRLIAPLGAGMIISFASSYYLLGVMADPIASATGATTAGLFSALSAAFLIAAFASMAAGRWIDRRGGREVLGCASLMLAAALALLASATGPASALAGVVMLGFGMGIGFYAPANALLVAVYGLEARRAITAVSLIGACGGAIGWPLSLFLMEVMGWRGALWFWVATHLLVCIPLYALMPDGKGERSDKPADRVRWDRRMWQLAVLFAGAWWIATACAAQLPRLLMALGLEPAIAAMAASTMALSAIAMRVGALFSPPKASPVRIVRMATLLYPLGVIIALVGGKAASIAIAIGQGAGNGLLSVASGILPLHVFGKVNYGQRQAAVLLPARFVQAIAPMSFGLALDRSAGAALMLSCSISALMFAMTFGLEAKSLFGARIAAGDRA
ncbi:MFS transporter [uncultured Brevundimonas sp.]|uniref:MFS transporter n=1 Tax=uncultured Brevundimonas sp. TaxID=213418 RepID=UPI002632DFDA|nr:MFS transporter [uncultured Brevundimonas sp.]